MKIGLVFDGSLDSNDGVAQYVLTLGTWLDSQGHNVHYLVGETKRQDLRQLHSLARNIHVRFNQNRLLMPLPAGKKMLRDLLQREQFDVLHIQMPYSPFLAGRIIKAAGSGTAIVGTFHVLPSSWLVHAGNWVLAKSVRNSLKKFDAVISNTKPTHDFARATFGVESDIIPLGLALKPFFDGQAFREYKTVKTIVFLGRLVERKGCQFVLKAVAKLVRDDSWPMNGKVIICGDGPLKLTLVEFVHEHGLTDIVEFKGFISEADKPRYLASGDVVAFPSTGGESFGIVLLEAMAAARGAVLAGDNPGYSAVLHNHPETLFAPRDTDVLAEKIITLLSDDQARATARHWQQIYVKEFDIAKVVGPRTIKVYHQALRKKTK